MRQLLSATPFFDFDHPEVQIFANSHISPGMSDKEKAVALYYAVRDEIRYNPYTFSFQPKTFRASHCLIQGQSYCVPKAILLGALTRYCGIPSRLGLADVRNHIASPALLEWMRTDVFAMHGYIELYINGKWVKATPAFNRALCEKIGVEPLEFDGEQDSIFHAFTGDGEQHMEYITDHGVFSDVPIDLFLGHMKAVYPHLQEISLSSGRSMEKEI